MIARAAHRVYPLAMGLGRTRALCAVVLAAGLIFATPVAASADDPDDPGKSSVVAACKKGGWMALAPEDDAAVPFRNQGECVRYLAQGGAVVATTGTPVLPGQGRGCKASKQKAAKEDSLRAAPDEACSPGKSESERKSERRPSASPSEGRLRAAQRRCRHRRLRSGRAHPDALPCRS